jgi:hypothetical protein
LNPNAVTKPHRNVGLFYAGIQWRLHEVQAMAMSAALPQA